MASYIGLMKMTEQGVKSVKELPGRVEGNIKRLKEKGIEVKSWHLTMGRYDVVVMFEAPSDEVATQAALVIGGQGNTRTETLRAFTLEEAKKLIGGI
jgi:uncharacterized protein with GYD domain